MKIVCIGGGPAGLYFALLMKKADPGHDVVVYERNPPDVTHGWGVTFWDTLLDELRVHDVESADAMAAAAFCWSGQDVTVQGSPLERVTGSGYGIDRQTLINLLTERAVSLGVRVEFGHEVDLADVTDGADLVVAADGVRSRVRALHAKELGARVRTLRNKFVWLGTPKVFDSFLFAFVETDAGWLWCYAYGYSDDRSTFVVECSPETWHQLDLDRMGPEQTVQLLERLFAAELDGQPLMLQKRGEDVVPWQSFPLVTAQSWHHDNVVLMGDSAHTTHFSIGSGTMLALEDAMSLAQNLWRSPDLPEALQAYESERQEAIAQLQSEALLSSQWFENVPRYAALEPQEFAGALHRRRSPVLAKMPPGLYFQLRRPMDHNRAVRHLWRRIRSVRRSQTTSV